MKQEFSLNEVLANRIGGSSDTWKIAMSETFVKMWRFIPIYSMRSRHIHVIWTTIQSLFYIPSSESTVHHQRPWQFIPLFHLLLATRYSILRYYSDYNLNWVLFGPVNYNGNQRWKRIASPLSWDKNNNNHVHSNTYKYAVIFILFFLSFPLYASVSAF